MSLEKRMGFYALLMFLGTAIIFVAACVNDSPENPFLWIGLAVTLIASWYRYRHIRCPHCGSRMKYIRQLPEHCPDCGGKIV